MLVVGAKGHAKEILDILDKVGNTADLFFFDNVSSDLPKLLFGQFKILKTESEVREVFKVDPSFILGVGNVKARFMLYKLMKSWGGLSRSIIADSAEIGSYNVTLNDGLNIMQRVFVSNSVAIGKGSLINAGSNIHHDTCIGKFCEISPGSIITGGVEIGDYTSIGSGAVIIPNIKIGSNVVIGAGAVVTKNIQSNSVAVGCPARIIKSLKPLNLG